MSVTRSTSSLTSERAILSLVLTNPEVLEEAQSLGLEDNHFHDPVMRLFWTRMLDERKRGVGPDEATLLESFEGDVGTWPLNDWAQALTVVNEIRGTPARREHLRRYVELMIEYRTRRKLIEVSKQVLALHDGGDPTEDMLRLAHRGTLQAAEGSAGDPNPPTAHEILETALIRQLAALRGELSDEVVPTGTSLDRTLSLRRGDYCIIAGRPSMGKTQLALTIIRNIARSLGPTMFISAEMGPRQMGQRLASAEMDTDVTEDSIQRALAVWEDVPLRFDFKSRSLSRILAAIRVAKQRHDIAAVAVDYIQRIRVSNTDSRERGIAEASMELANLAAELDILLICVSQLNRQCEQRTDKRPMMSDLRESGQLEQDADQVVFVYRDVYYKPTTERPNEAEVIIAKQRNGPTGTEYLYFDPAGPSEDRWFRTIGSNEGTVTQPRGYMADPEHGGTWHDRYD